MNVYVCKTFEKHLGNIYEKLKKNLGRS